jgi:hypothetical protein
MMAVMVVPNRRASEYRVSPCCTTYICQEGGGPRHGNGVGVGRMTTGGR